MDDQRHIVGLVRKLVQPLANRVKQVVTRVVLTAIDDSLKMQMVQFEGVADQVREQIERLQEYGFTSVPDKGAEGVALKVGVGSHQVIIATDDRRYRPKNLQPGDVALYRLAEGILVKLLAGQNVELGPSPTDYVALSIPTKAEITAVRDSLNALVSNVDSNFTAIQTTLTPMASAFNVAGPLVGAPGTVTPYAKVAPTAPNPVGDVKATKVKAI